MQISDLKCDVLIAGAVSTASCDTAQDNALVRVVSENGMVGLGEAESNPWIIKACVEAPGSSDFTQSLRQLLVGRELVTPPELWDYLYERTFVTGRRGAGITALGAVDMALWDLWGKVCGRPVWQLLREHMKRPGEALEVTPYASLLPVGSTLAEYRKSMISKALWASDAGFKGVKLEIMIKGPYAVNGLRESDSAVIELVRLGREAIGTGPKLMIDVGYCWDDWRDAAAVLRKIEKFDVYFVETPLPFDDLDSHARLVEATDVPIAAGELLQTRFEFEDLMDRGKVNVIQPDVGRVGGLTEAMRVVMMAEERGLTVVPHCWKSGLGIAATAHLAATSPNCAMIEFLPAEVSESPLRSELLLREIPFEDGLLGLNGRSGLGIDLNESVFSRRVHFSPMSLENSHLPLYRTVAPSKR